MPRADRGSVRIVDLGLVGKVRPCCSSLGGFARGEEIDQR